MVFQTYKYCVDFTENTFKLFSSLVSFAYHNCPPQSLRSSCWTGQIALGSFQDIKCVVSALAPSWLTRHLQWPRRTLSSTIAGTLTIKDGAFSTEPSAIPNHQDIKLSFMKSLIAETSKMRHQALVSELSPIPNRWDIENETSSSRLRWTIANFQ